MICSIARTTTRGTRSTFGVSGKARNCIWSSATTTAWLSGYRDAGLISHATGLVELPFILEHEAPLAIGGAGMFHVICGHTHPGIVLHGQANQSLRLPCFLVGPQVTMLPAFGMSTGLYTVKPTPAHRLFACTDKAVLDVTGVVVGQPSKS